MQKKSTAFFNMRALIFNIGGFWQKERAEAAGLGEKKRAEASLPPEKGSYVPLCRFTQAGGKAANSAQPLFFAQGKGAGDDLVHIVILIFAQSSAEDDVRPLRL